MSVVIGLSISGFASAGVLDALRSMEENSWQRVNVNAISSVWTPLSDRNDDNTLQGNNLPAIINAWSSFAWDSNRSSLIVYGGGHANYSGNDVYTWDGSTLAWERSSLPSKIVQTNTSRGLYGAAADGYFNAPASAHTYDNTVFLKQSDRYLTFGGAAFGPGDTYLKVDGGGNTVRSGPFVFNPNLADPNKVGGTTGSGVNPAREGGNMWQNRDTYTTRPSDPKPLSYINGVSDSAVEGGKDVVYLAGRGGGTSAPLYRYTINNIADPTQDTWQLIGPSDTGVAEDGGGAYDPNSKIFVRTGDSTRQFVFWDTSLSGNNNTDRAIVPTDLTGGAAPTRLVGYGLAYDQRRDRFLFWGGGSNIWYLDDPATVGTTGWTVGRATDVGEVGPGAIDTVGIQGKWQYAPELDAFIALQGPSTGDVWVYKPAGWIDPIPEPKSYVMIALGLVMTLWMIGRSDAGSGASSAVAPADPEASSVSAALRAVSFASSDSTSEVAGATSALSVTAIPEPKAYALMGLGVAMLGASRVFNKKRS